MALSEVAIDDYLKSIYAHTEWQDAPITGSQLAARLELAPSTVTEMVRKLGRLGFVEHRPYGSIALTEAGRERALRMVRRHRLIETWLVERHGYTWDEVHDEAEVLEHAISDRLLDSLDAELGSPTHDPHGDPIPDRDGRVELPPAVRWDALDSGTGRVVRISDRDPEVLRTLAGRGIGIGSSVDASGAGLAEAEAVWVVPDPRSDG